MVVMASIEGADSTPISLDHSEIQLNKFRNFVAENRLANLGEHSR